MTWLARLLLALLGLGLLAVLLFALLCYTVYAAVRWLLTGRKPQVVLVWQQFSALRKNFTAGGRAAPHSTARGPGTETDAQVVDVEAREILDDAPRLPKHKP